MGRTTCPLIGLIVVAEGEGVGTVVGFLCIVSGAGCALKARRVYADALVPPGGWSSNRTYVITEQGLTSRTDATSTWWDWSVVRSVEVCPAAYLFRQDVTVFDVPRHPLTNDEDAELSGFLASRGMLLESRNSARA